MNQDLVSRIDSALDCLEDDDPRAARSILQGVRTILLLDVPAMREGDAAPKLPEPFQPIESVDLDYLEGLLPDLMEKSVFFPADAHTLANMTAHMIREVRASRAATTQEQV